MLLIDNDVVKRVLTMRECIEAQERAFAGTLTGASVSRPRIDMFVPCNRADGYYRWGSVEGASDGVLAVRLKSDIMTWPEGPDGTRTESKYCIQPGTYCGLVLLFSTQDGAPLAIIHDGYLQHMRVGASAGIGARLLARENAHAVGMIGSGGMARSVLESLVQVRDIKTVKVYSRIAANRDAFARTMTEYLDVAVEPVASAREAVRGADILATCTDSMYPVIEGGWIERGMHVVNIGPHDLGPDAAARCRHQAGRRCAADTGRRRVSQRCRPQPRRFCRRQPGRADAAAAVLAQARRAIVGPTVRGGYFRQGARPYQPRPDHPVPAGRKLGSAILIGRRGGVSSGEGAGSRSQAAGRMVLAGHQELKLEGAP
jgi:alanine dehydrogenase